ncbi:MAG: hypothetical protein ISR20_05835 [Candidatus Poseidonia sp.]|nr:hypothetical protein [Poseidonia sp.]MBL6893086.1 hypothetical protein [Poseidonia sp.]
MEYDEMAAGGARQVPVFPQAGAPMSMPMHGTHQIMIPQKKLDVSNTWNLRHPLRPGANRVVDVVDARQ